MNKQAITADIALTMVQLLLREQLAYGPITEESISRAVKAVRDMLLGEKNPDMWSRKAEEYASPRIQTLPYIQEIKPSWPCPFHNSIPWFGINPPECTCSYSVTTTTSTGKEPKPYYFGSPDDEEGGSK